VRREGFGGCAGYDDDEDNELVGCGFVNSGAHEVMNWE
jgi:hypothetical protein